MITYGFNVRITFVVIILTQTTNRKLNSRPHHILMHMFFGDPLTRYKSSKTDLKGVCPAGFLLTHPLGIYLERLYLKLQPHQVLWIWTLPFNVFVDNQLSSAILVISAKHASEPNPETEFVFFYERSNSTPRCIKEIMNKMDLMCNLWV